MQCGVIKFVIAVKKQVPMVTVHCAIELTYGTYSPPRAKITYRAHRLSMSAQIIELNSSSQSAYKYVVAREYVVQSTGRLCTGMYGTPG